MTAKFLDKFVLFLKKINVTISFFMIILMFTSVTANVIGRYFFNYSLAFVDEFARYTFIWMVFAGAVVAYEEGEHISLQVVVKKLSARKQKFVNTINKIMEAVFSVVTAFYGFKIFSLINLNISPTLGVPMGYFYISISWALLCIAIIATIRIFEKKGF